MKNGPYEMVLAPVGYPGKRYRGKYVYEHQLVWWESTGQLVPAGSVVHHKDEQKRNNVFSNLELKTNSKHASEHGQEKSARVMTTAVCGWCQSEFKILPSKLRMRLKQTASGEFFCCKSHSVLRQQDARRERLSAQRQSLAPPHEAS